MCYLGFWEFINSISSLSIGFIDLSAENHTIECKSGNLLLCVTYQFISTLISQSYFYNTKCICAFYFNCVYLLENYVIDRKVLS